MRRNWKRGAAALLTASMLFSNISITGLAEEASAQAEEASAQAEEAPAPTTEAPTEAPAPATEAPTEAPAPATEAPTEAPAPATEAPTEAPAPATEAPTEAPAPATEAPTEAPAPATETSTEKPTDTEKKTEKETEDGIYTVEEKEYTVSVEVPDDCKIPDGASLVANIVKKDSKEAKEDLKLAQEAAGDDTEIAGYQIYDLHFEKNKKEIELTPREKADIKVTIAIDKKEFQKDLKEEGLEVFHIRDLTEEELEKLKKEESESQEQDQTEKEVTQTAEKLKIKKAEEKDGKETITFSTDGFSDYLFAVTKEKQTESETAKETETEAPETSASETAGTETQPDTPAQSEEPETTAPQIAVREGEAQITQADLTLTMKMTGTKTTAKDLVLTATNIGDLQAAVQALGTSAKELKVTQGTGANEKDVVGVTIEKNCITIPAAALENGTTLHIANLPVNGDGATAEAPKTATYTIHAGGNFVTNIGFSVTSDYYTVYKNAEGTLLPSTDGSCTVSMEKSQGLTIENVYSAVTVSASDKDKTDSKFAGMSFSVVPDGATAPVYTVTADDSGKAMVRGLPAGKYTVTGDAGTIPKKYKSEAKSQEITVDESGNLSSAVNLTYSTMTLTLKAINSRSGKPLANAKITVKKADKTVAFETTDSEGLAKVTGVLERGEKYTISQTRMNGYYSAASKNLSSGTYTVNAAGEDPTITFSSQPTVVKIGVIDNVSKTSPYAGSYVKGASVAIKKDGKVLETITTEGQLVEVVGLLNPNTKYQIVQTAAPAGYIVGAVTDSGSYSVGKQISLSSKTKKEKIVEISADTVKVLVSRKGYDSRTQVTKNGKKAYEYTNLKLLSGAKLEIRDKDGNVVKDQNGNPISWTSSEKGGHLVEGVLAASTEYTLVETGAPEGYDLAGSGVFHTYKSGNQAAVTMQTRKASGSIRVVMRAAYKGSAIKVNGTYYCALFTDKNLTKRYTAAGVRRLTMTTSQVYAEVTFENIPAGVYYVAETDKDGNPLKNNATFKVNNPTEGLHMDASKDLIAEITNDFVTEPAGAQKVSSSELRNSYHAEYAGYGGSASAAAELAAGGNSVQTGDTTNVTLYLSMLAVACLLFAAAVIVRKRRKE